jgi:uncharacterized membrane protein YesL
MKTSGAMGKLFVLFEWITRLAYVNVLWIGFSLIGILIVGFFPATSAMFAMTRNWITGEKDLPVFQTFWKRYKTDFWKANGIGWLMFAIGVILYLDYLYFTTSGSTLFFLLKSFSIMLAFVFILISVMLFPVFVHYNLTVLHLFRNALFISMLHPLKSVLLIFGIATIGYIFLLVPSLIPFFSGSVIALYVTWLTQSMFSKIDQRQGKAE